VTRGLDFPVSSEGQPNLVASYHTQDAETYSNLGPHVLPFSCLLKYTRKWWGIVQNPQATALDLELCSTSYRSKYISSGWIALAPSLITMSPQKYI
jgi:hypothetical protein